MTSGRMEAVASAGRTTERSPVGGALARRASWAYCTHFDTSRPAWVGSALRSALFTQYSPGGAPSGPPNALTAISSSIIVLAYWARRPAEFAIETSERVARTDPKLGTTSLSDWKGATSAAM